MCEKRFSVRLRSECDGVVYSFFDGDKPLDVEMIVDLLNEQQATIRKLQDLCGKSDGENMKLRIENKRLQKELNDCEKFRYTVFKRLNDEHIKECSIR